MKKISLCVPSYNRPETLRDLIYSYLHQTYANKELVISDDSPTNVVEAVIRELDDGTFRYFHNRESLGFPRNYLASLTRASGDYRLTLGDDDILASEKALERYVAAFESNPHVGFVYSNQVQFGTGYDVECVITKFSRDEVVNSGEDAVKRFLIHSVFIGGQGYRGDIPFREWYPQNDLLHPQVYLAGSVLAHYAGCGLSEYAVGVRSHQDQIIFRALKDKGVRREGTHVNIELLDIFEALRGRYGWKFNNDFLASQLIENYKVLILKEKVILGDGILAQYYQEFCDRCLLARRSLKLGMVYFICRLLPASIVSLIRSVIMRCVKLRNRKAFGVYRQKLRLLVSVPSHTI
jgi:glycosyltransferase involved in cell wall biosynthesis